MLDDDEFIRELDDTPEEQFLTLAKSLHILIYGLFILAGCPCCLNIVGLWPAPLQLGGSRVLAWFFLAGPSLLIICVSMVGFFLAEQRDSRRWFVGAIMAALGWLFLMGCMNVFAL
jgi:hypothetical protein